LIKCFVGGVSGAGKTTLLTTLQRESNGCTVIQGSQLLFSALGFPNDDYATLKALPAELKDGVFSEEIQTLLDREEAARHNVLLDAHYLNFTQGTHRNVVFDWVRRMDVLILIEADAETILRRVRSDKHRADRITDPSAFTGDPKDQLRSITNSLEQTRAEAERLSLKYGKPLRTIDNSRDLDSAVGALSRIVESNWA
jgi:adenylate kinase